MVIHMPFVPIDQMARFTLREALQEGPLPRVGSEKPVVAGAK